MLSDRALAWGEGRRRREGRFYLMKGDRNLKKGFVTRGNVTEDSHSPHGAFLRSSCEEDGNAMAERKSEKNGLRKSHVARTSDRWSGNSR